MMSDRLRRHRVQTALYKLGTGTRPRLSLLRIFRSRLLEPILGRPGAPPDLPDTYFNPVIGSRGAFAPSLEGPPSARKWCFAEETAWRTVPHRVFLALAIVVCARRCRAVRFIPVDRIG
jgi:hypothetical protein